MGEIVHPLIFLETAPARSNLSILPTRLPHQYLQHAHLLIAGIVSRSVFFYRQHLHLHDFVRGGGFLHGLQAEEIDG